MPEARTSSRKSRIGIVVTDKMSQTVVVRIERLVKHPLYPKRIRSSNTFHAHNDGNKAKAGDLVKITETRPLSKTKRWRVVEILRRGTGSVELAETPGVSS
jgi:small subunit ribosomal protein S17